MARLDELKAVKHDARAADRHAPARPADDAALWARTLTTKRVADLFRTEAGLPGHWTQVQAEVNAGNRHFTQQWRTTEQGKQLIAFISDAIISAARRATFDFPPQQLKFTADTGWLKIERSNGQVLVRSRAR